MVMSRKAPPHGVPEGTTTTTTTGARTAGPKEDNDMASKRLVAAGVGAGLLLGGASGLALTLPTGAFAQDDTPAPTEAPAEGMRGGPMSGILDELVANGTITQEQADAIVGAAEARRGERPGGERGMRGPGGERGMRGPGGERGMRGAGGPGASLDTAAEVIGISVEDLRTQLRDGQSLAAIAEANGVGTDALVDALTEDARGRITEMVQRVPGEKHNENGSDTGEGTN